MDFQKDKILYDVLKRSIPKFSLYGQALSIIMF